ncbi:MULTISPECIES: hypothetical protein [unclassified Sphingomonas]|uniref:hypothetical protein n=1 Tax=unclassified Sphingomonas TaxID=196159 RepID=UPI0006F840C2|nr:MULTISPECIES: hypothetical protein [unclassified Sphingomonas]KQM58769.1 hypothetical protein ASE65_10420 [Sphingomonas sp. Leaf16]KQN11024.1 hypothetical protein ASE81_11405 [Sphingomonas sp. Leaf29]KQN18326.1 hypothetical protein ASE83_11345 [Sphingomonas sp. Leaf32]
MKAFTPHDWSPAEDDTIRNLFAVGKTYHQIALALGLPIGSVSKRGYNLGLRRGEAVDIPASGRWTCGHCNTRSDAPLTFGCAKCLPLRRAAA